MRLKSIKDVTSRDGARELAIEWQNNTSQKSISYGELALASVAFTELAIKFNLVEEFEENGII